MFNLQCIIWYVKVLGWSLSYRWSELFSFLHVEYHVLLVFTLFSYITGKYCTALCTEEEQCEDLSLFMQLLINLTTKDYSSFPDDGMYDTYKVYNSALEYCIVSRVMCVRDITTCQWTEVYSLARVNIVRKGFLLKYLAVSWLVLTLFQYSVSTELIYIQYLNQV